MNDFPTVPSDFPRFDGKIIGLEWLPPKSRKVYEDQIRDWCRLNPDRKLWPEFLQRWPERKKQLERFGK